MLLFLTTNMAAVTSHANQQYGHLWDRPFVPCWGHIGAMLGVNTVAFFLEEFYIKTEFCSQSREMLLFLTTNMAAVMSHANQQYGHLWDRPYVPCWDHVGGQYSSIFSRIIYMKIEFSSQKERNAFVLDHHHGRRDVTCKPAIRTPLGPALRAMLGPCWGSIQ